MAKKSKRQGDAATATEAPEPEKEAADREGGPSTAGAADSGTPRKSRRRGVDTATAAPEVGKEVAEREASAAAADKADSGKGTPEGKKPKLKKRKKNKQEQSPSAAVSDADANATGKSGKGSSDGEGAPRDSEVTTSPRNAEDPSFHEGNVAEKGTPEGKKRKLKKRKKNKKEQSPSAVSDARAVAVDESGKGCIDLEGALGDAEVSTCPRNAEDLNCPEVIIDELGTPEKKKPKRKKRKKNKMEQSPSAVLNANAVEADESGNGCTGGEGASGVAELSMSPRNGYDSNCPEVNMAEKSKPEEKKPKLKKRKKSKKEQSPSTVADADAVAAGKSGNECTDGEGAPEVAETNMSPRNGKNPGCPEVNIAENGTPEGKKPKLKKQKKNKQGRSPSAVSDEGAVEADKSGNSCTEWEGVSGDAEVSVSPRNGEDLDCTKVNIAEKGTPERKKSKLKKGKKNKLERSHSAVSDADDVVVDKSGYGSTNVEAEPGDAEASMSPRNGEDPDCPKVNIAEDPVEGKKGNKEKSQKPKLKKRKKNKQEGSPSAVADTGAVAADKSGNGCTDEEGAPGDGDVSMSPRNIEDPHFPELNIAEDLVEGKQGNEDNSQNPKRKKQKKKRKRNQVGVTEAPSVDVRWTGPVGKMDGKVQLDLSEEEAKKITKGMRSSICESEVTASNVSLTLVQGVEPNAKAKASCLHARSDKSDFISKTSTSGGNYKEKVRDIYSPRGSLVRFQRKKLLILDLNGLLADINQDHHNAHMSHAKVRGKLVFKRPYHDDFLRFCFQNFELGIWSSRMKVNVDSVVNILMKDLKQYLLFCWDLSKCTTTGRNTLENQHKPLVLKELKKLWNKEEHDLPWEQGEFSPSNTLLVDDSPYKALRNPPHTAIFPHPYSYHNKKDDSLGPGGDLRVYLENLAAADDVQRYVQEHPFGQPSITESDPHWNFYVQILDKLEKPAA